MRKGLMSMPDYSLESIGFQSGIFFKELTQAYEKLKKLKPHNRGDLKVIQDYIEYGVVEDPNPHIKDEDDIDAAALLGAIVRHHTGLSVTFNIGDYEPSVYIPTINNNHAFFKGLQGDFAPNADAKQLFSKYGKHVRGNVNLRTSRVEGAFCDIVSMINMPFKMFIGELYTAAEMAAITLHEVGHLFTYYEFITRSISTNQILQGVARMMDNTAGADEREALLLTLKTAAKLNDLDVAELSKTTNKTVVESVVLSNIIKVSESEIGSNIYDMNTWEMMSDQFATRHGAGRSLATALDKIYKSSWNISYRSTFGFMFFEAVKVILLAGVFFGTAPLLLMFYLMDCPSRQYDRPGVRIQRIRNQILERSKMKGLSKAEKEMLETDLVIVDDIHSKIKDRLQLFNCIGLFFKSNRERYASEKLQQELETLSANDLFKASNLLTSLL